MAKLKCNVCGEEFNPTLERHYIVRDCETYGLILGPKEEPILYDAFDCPKCGCQIIIGERKRPRIIKEDKDESNDI